MSNIVLLNMLCGCFVVNGVLGKNEIRGFWDMVVGIISKCPQMSIIKVLVHKSFEFGGICTWPSLAVLHGLTRWLGGEFWKKNEISGFW